MTYVGVESRIIDLSTYVQAIPSTIGFVCGLSRKGEDNKLRFVGGRPEYISEWGEPDVPFFGKQFGQGGHVAYNYLGESGALYFMRCLPEDASYSNIRIDATDDVVDATSEIKISYVDSATNFETLQTSLEGDNSTYPICVIYPIGRGEYYNSISVRFTKHANQTLFGTYVMDVYEKQSNGEDAIIESFEVSFDPTAKDNVGESIWIVNVLERYSSFLRAEMQLASGEYSPGHKKVTRVYDNNVGDVTVNELTASLRDNKQDFTNWSSSTTGEYVAIVKDPKGRTIWGWIGSTIDSENEEVEIYETKDLNTRGWNGDVGKFDFNTDQAEYQIRKSYISIDYAFMSADPVPLKKGSEGSLLDSTGEIDTATATNVLAEGYAGLIDGDVLDTENIYYSVVFDAGYPLDVKNEIASLVQTRRDCVAIMDNGDNPTFEDAITAREEDHTWNTYLVSIYENYSKVNDIFAGEDVWVSPVFHMSYLVPRNDNIGDIWFALAGLNERGTPGGIKELRYNPRLGQRDQLYLNQLNPIVKLDEGYTVWSQLTSQAKPSKLQDLNIVRTVLYIQRALEQYCRFYIFNMNDAVTWSAVQGDITEFLERIRRTRGLRSFSVSVGATPYEMKTKQFHVDVELTPTTVVEKINLNFFIR